MALEFMGPAMLRAGDSIVALSSGAAERGAELAASLDVPAVYSDYRPPGRIARERPRRAPDGQSGLIIGSREYGLELAGR
jgi:hypothetical protein